MSRNRLPFMLIVALALLVLGALPGLASPLAQPQPAPIKLKAAHFTPARGEKPAIPPGLTIAGYGQNQRGYYLVQFAGPVQQSWKDGLAALGGELLDYVPDFAFKVRMSPGQAQKAAGASGVAWVGLFHPAYKLSPDLARNGTLIYYVRVEQGADLAVTADAITRTGASVLGRDGALLTVAADAAQLDAIAHVLDVAWLQNAVLPEKHNEYGGGVLIGASSANAAGYDGSTQTVAVADTGLGGGTATTAHPDIPAGRIGAVYNWRGVDDSCWSITDDGPQDVDSGHGTHVSLSVLGDGGANGVGAGPASGARLVFQATENWATMKGICALLYSSGYYLTGLPTDLRTLFQQAYDAGARIHANSWGSDVKGDYTANSAYADSFVWGHRDMAITFSAGNAGIDANRDGLVDNDSIGAPATAKNVITVGASENDRQGHWECDLGLSYTDSQGRTCASLGGQNDLFTWGTAWPDDYPTNPLKDDRSAGNAQQMAAFSSRGPTDDGRIKPDVVAPGSWILSGYSDKYQQGYDGSPNPKNGAWQYDGYGFPLNSQYKYLSGTSMSNPLVAGGAAVVRDFYQKANGHAASAALVKATLINSAVDLLDENNDGANDNDYPIPNSHEGWGMLNLASATDGSHLYVDSAAGLATGAVSGYSYSVSGGSALRVSLVWSDYPSTEAAAKNLVNDLDLVVTAPDGTVYQGNVFGAGWSQPGGSADRTNNVENVFVSSAAAGSWRVEVRGYNVPNGPQPFALVVDGGSGGAPLPTPQPATLHVADLDGTRAAVNNKNWRATISVTVHDANHLPVANVSVSGSWSGGTSGSASCLTDASGRCSITSSNISTKQSSVTFTIAGLSRAGYSYDAAANHDPEADSNGTRITVTKP